MTSRYASFTFPAFAILLALGIDAFRNNRIKGALLGWIVAVSGISLANYYFNPQYQNEQWREAAGYVEAQEQPGDIVIFYADHVQLAFDYYYQGDAQRAGLTPVAELGADEVWSRLQEMIDGHERVWLVLAHAFGSGDEVYKQLLDEHCFLSEQRDFKGIQLALYEACSP